MVQISYFTRSTADSSRYIWSGAFVSLAKCKAEKGIPWLALPLVVQSSIARRKHLYEYKGTYSLLLHP